MSCPWIDPCSDNHHVETRGENKEGRLTEVHTCVVCNQKSIAIWEGMGCTGGQVPDDCPRWHPTSGSALPGGACATELDEIKKRHPFYEAKMASIMKMMDGVFLTLKGQKDDLASRRFARDYTKAAIPGTVMLAEELRDDPMLEVRTEAVFTRLYAHAGVDQDLIELAAKLEEAESWKWQWVVGTLMEAVFLAIRHHGPNAEAIAREYRLAFADSQARWVWRDKPVEERREIYSRWIELIQAGLDAVEPAPTLTVVQ